MESRMRTERSESNGSGPIRREANSDCSLIGRLPHPPENCNEGCARKERHSSGVPKVCMRYFLQSQSLIHREQWLAIRARAPGECDSFVQNILYCIRIGRSRPNGKQIQNSSPSSNGGKAFLGTIAAVQCIIKLH